MPEPIRRKLVKDAQWGTLALLPWEREILDHPIFARLHNILQNSTAFRVYPSLRTSRYVHSIGVMHVATEMFRASVIESRPEFLRRLIDGEPRTPEGIRTLQEEAVALTAKVEGSEREHVVSLVRAIFPVRYSNGEAACDSIHVALAALRLAALLHDVGHLPASHIFEFAIEDAATEPEKRAETLAAITVEKHKKALEKFFEWTLTFPQAKFHEGVGKLIIDDLASDCGSQRSAIEANISNTLRAASAILHETTGSHAPLCLHSFISSVLDADRIDFVRRDNETSGLLRSSVDYGRLLRFMELRPVNLKTTSDSSAGPHLIVMPGARAHADVEKLLVERFQDYRYIAAHHRVHLGDELLARCIGILLRKDKLNDAISALVNLSRPEAGGNTGKLASKGGHLRTQLYLCTRFDDSWLEMQLRDLWLAKDENDEAAGLNAREGLLLDAHIQNGSTLESGFHREEDFLDYSRSRIGEPNLAWLREIEGMFAEQKAPQAFQALQKVARVVKENKLKWEEELFAIFEERLILVGDLGSKLKTGFPPTNRLISDSMEDLIPAAEFLNAKIRRALVFNVWFDTSLMADKEKIFDAVCQKIATTIAGRRSQHPSASPATESKSRTSTPPPRLFMKHTKRKRR